VKELVSFQFPGPLYHSAAVEVCWNMRSPVCGVLVEAILDVPFEKEVGCTIKVHPYNIIYIIPYE